VNFFNSGEANKLFAISLLLFYVRKSHSTTNNSLFKIIGLFLDGVLLVVPGRLSCIEVIGSLFDLRIKTAE
jgi:hypothetical protein